MKLRNFLFIKSDKTNPINSQLEGEDDSIDPFGYTFIEGLGLNPTLPTAPMSSSELKKTSKKSMGEFIYNRFYLMVNEGIKIRQENNINLIDVNYNDLKENPEKLMITISKKIDIKINKSNCSTNIKRFKTLKNKHKYSIEEFGLNKEKIYKKFDNYIKRYNIIKEY